jgi:hypothetical protein
LTTEGVFGSDGTGVGRGRSMAGRSIPLGVSAFDGIDGGMTGRGRNGGGLAGTRGFAGVGMAVVCKSSVLITTDGSVVISSLLGRLVDLNGTRVEGLRSVGEGKGFPGCVAGPK